MDKGLLLAFCVVGLIALFAGLATYTPSSLAPDGITATTTLKEPGGKTDDWAVSTTTTVRQRATTTTLGVTSSTSRKTGGGTDDWQYNGNRGDYELLMQVPSVVGGVNKMAGARMAENIGFAAGGAKDVNNFRENIANGYLPIPTDLTYEGLFYDYYFDTGKIKECSRLFCPSYSLASSKDPLSKKKDVYLSVGLNSGMKAEDFKRKRLNLVVVLDMSGSMGSAFDSYYYDRFGRQVNLTREEVESGTTKMEVATKSLVALADHLRDDDRFGMVVYDDSAYLAKPLSRVGDTDMGKIKGHILELSPRGGTRMEAGMRMGSDMLNEYILANPEEYENRIIFLTDAMPNLGDTSEAGLLGITGKNSENQVYATFIGIGVDFNTDLIETITKIRGANYYSVHSSQEFKKRLEEEFEYMVTPLVFNLKLELDAPGYEILKVYGSPEADEATGEIMKVNTLFPSKVDAGETRGGLVLLKLRNTGEGGQMKLRVTYEDRTGKRSSDEQTVDFSSQDERYDNTGIRKGVLLARYADLLKNWVVDQRASHIPDRPILAPCVKYETGIVIPCHPHIKLGEWERQSMPLEVSPHYAAVFRDFSIHFKAEKEAIGDDSLQKELDLLEKLSTKAGDG